VKPNRAFRHFGDVVLDFDIFYLEDNFIFMLNTFSGEGRHACWSGFKTDPYGDSYSHFWPAMETRLFYISDPMVIALHAALLKTPPLPEQYQDVEIHPLSVVSRTAHTIV
jgi:hypothetical protein